MLLAVDIGNSRIKFGVYDGERLVEKVSAPTPRNHGFELGHFADIEAAIICSVVPEANETVAHAIREKFVIEPKVVQNDFDFGLKILHTPLETIGTDRLVNAFSAVEKYTAPCIVCSMGTALTIDFVDQGRVLRGGVIAPGMRVLGEALHRMTSRLPEVEIGTTETVLQQTTVGAIQSGLVNGFVGLVESIIQKIQVQVDADAKVIATGGNAKFVADQSDLVEIVDEDLLLDGLQHLYSTRFPNAR